MLRLTPQRLAYLVIGVVLGAVIFAGYVSVTGLPRFLPSFATAPAAPSAAGAPSEFTGSTLVKVVPVNQLVTKNGVTFRINTLEQYSDGFTMTYSLLNGQAGVPALILQPDQFGVTDDRGVSYRLSALGSSSTVAPGLSTGYLSFSPPLSADARVLTVVVPHGIVISGGPDSGSSRVVDGPWQVQVTVR